MKIVLHGFFSIQVSRLEYKWGWTRRQRTIVIYGALSVKGSLEVRVGELLNGVWGKRSVRHIFFNELQVLVEIEGDSLKNGRYFVRLTQYCWWVSGGKGA